MPSPLLPYQEISIADDARTHDGRACACDRVRASSVASANECSVGIDFQNSLGRDVLAYTHNKSRPHNPSSSKGVGQSRIRKVKDKGYSGWIFCKLVFDIRRQNRLTADTA